MKVILMKHNTDDQMNWAGNDDTRKYLKLGETYEVDRIKQGSSYTRYYIGGKKFNHICFETAIHKGTSCGITEQKMGEGKVSVCPVCQSEDIQILYKVEVLNIPQLLLLFY